MAKGGQEQNKHAFRQFSEDLKAGNIPGVVLLCGFEQYLARWAAGQLTEHFTEEASRSLDYLELQADEMPKETVVQAIIDACETFPMLSERKVVVVRNLKALGNEDPKVLLQEDRNELIRYLGEVPGHALLIFLAGEIETGKSLPKAIRQNGKIYQFDRLPRPDLLAFARKRIRGAGLAIRDRVLSDLIEETGYYNKDSIYDLYAFENDLRKLAAYAEGEIRPEDVAEAVHGDENSFVFDLLDSISAGRRDKAFALLYNILTDENDAMGLIALITSQFEIMLSVKQMREDGVGIQDMGKRMGVNEFRIRKMMPHVQKFSVDKLKEILGSAYQLEKQIKTSLLRPRMALELFIAGI